jgi:hypothetical protein
MVHKLAQRHPENACGPNPLIVSLRYRCECGQNEVIQLSAVIDLNAPESHFMQTMLLLWRDVKFEVQQHLKPPPTEAELEAELDRRLKPGATYDQHARHDRR